MNILLNAIFGLWLVLLSPWPGSWTQQNSGQHLDSLKCCQNVDFSDFTSPVSIQRHSWLLMVNDDAGGSNPLGVGASIISFIKKTANSFGRGLANGIHHASGGGRRRLAPAPARMHRPRPAGGIKKRRNGRKKGRRNGRRRRPGSRRGGGRGQFPYMMEEDPGMDMHGVEPMMGHEGFHDPPVKPKSPEEAAGADNEVGEEEGPLMHEEHGSIPPDGNYPMHNGEMYNGDARNTENLKQSENPHSLDNPVEMEIQDPRHSHYEGHQPENIHPGHGMEQPVNHRHRWPPPRHSGHPDHQMPMTEKSHMPQQRGLSTPNGFLHQLVKSNADHGQRLSPSEQGEKFHNKKRTRTENADNDHLHNPVNLHGTQWNSHKRPKTPSHSTNGFEPEVGMRQQRPGHYQFPPHSNMSGMHNEFGHLNNPHDHNGFANENHSTHPKLPPFDPHSHLGRFDSHMPTKDQHGQFLPNHHGHRTQTAHFEPNHEEGQREEEEDDDKAKPMHLDSVEEFRKRKEQKSENEMEEANDSAGSRDKESEPPAMSHFGMAFQPPTPGHFSTLLPHQHPNLPHHIPSDDDISNHHLTGSNEEKTKMENGSGEERQEDGEVHRGQVRYPANEQNGFPLSGSAIGDENENGPSLLHRSATFNGMDSDRAELPPAMAKSAEQPSRSVELDRDDERHEQHQNQQQTDAHGFPIPTGLPGIGGHPGMGGHEMDHGMGGHIEPGSELINRHGEEEEHGQPNQIPPTHLGEQHQQMDAHGFPIPAGLQGIGGHSGMGGNKMSHGMNGHIDPEDQRHEEKEGGKQINRNPSAVFGGEQQTNANGFPMPTGLPGIGGHEMNHGMGSPIDPNHMHGERDEPAYRPVHGNMMDQNGQQGVADPSSSHLMGMGDHLSHQNIEPSGHFGEENHNHLMGTNHDHLLKNGQQTEPSGMGMDQMNHQSAYPNQQFPADIHTGMMPNQQNMQPGGWPGVEQPPGQLPHQAIDPLMPHQMDNNLPPYQQQMTPSTHQNPHNQNTLPHHQQQGQASANWPNQFPHQSSMLPHGQQPPPLLHQPSQAPDHLHSQIPHLQSQIPQQPNQVIPIQTQPFGSQTQNHHEGSQQQQHLPHQGQLPPIQQQFTPNNQSLQPQFPQHNPSQLPSSQQQLPHGLHNPTQLPHQQQLPQHHLSQQPHHLNRPIQSQHPFYDPNAAQTLLPPNEMFGQPPFAPGQQPELPHNLAQGQGNVADFSPGLDPLNGHHRNAEPAQNFPTVTVHAQPTTPVGQFEKLRSTIPAHLRPQISEPSVGTTNIFRGVDSLGGQHRNQTAGMLPTSYPVDHLHQPAAIHHPLTPIATPNSNHLGNIQPHNSGQNLHLGGHGNHWHGNANGGIGHGNHQAVQPQNFPPQNVGGMTAPTGQWHEGQLGERMQSKSVEMDGGDNMADDQNGDGSHHLHNTNLHGHQQMGNQNVALPSGQPHLNAYPPPTVSHQGLPNFQPPSPTHSSSNFNPPPTPVNSNAHLPLNSHSPNSYHSTAPNAVHDEHKNVLPIPTAAAHLLHEHNHEAQKAHDEHLHGGEKGQNLASNIADGKFEKAMVHIGKAQQSITKAVSLLERNEPARNLETGMEKNHHDGLMAHSPETQTPNHVDLPPPPLKSILKKRVANPRPHLKLLDDAKRQRHF